jgi:predicted CopG family antitoxin
MKWMDKPEYQRLNIQLDLPTYAALQDLSDKTGLSVAEVIRRCLARALEDVKKDAFADPEVEKYVKKRKRLDDALRTYQLDE